MQRKEEHFSGGVQCGMRVQQNWWTSCPSCWSTARQAWGSCGSSGVPFWMHSQSQHPQCWCGSHSWQWSWWWASWVAHCSTFSWEAEQSATQLSLAEATPPPCGCSRPPLFIGNEVNPTKSVTRNRRAYQTQVCSWGPHAQSDQADKWWRSCWCWSLLQAPWEAGALHRPYQLGSVILDITKLAFYTLTWVGMKMIWKKEMVHTKKGGIT